MHTFCHSQKSVSLPYSSGSQLGVTLPPRGHSAMTEDIFDCHSCWEGAIDIWWAEARDPAKPPTMHRTVSQNRSFMTQMSTVLRLRKLVLQ